MGGLEGSKEDFLKARVWIAPHLHARDVCQLSQPRVKHSATRPAHDDSARPGSQGQVDTSNRDPANKHLQLGWGAVGNLAGPNPGPPQPVPSFKDTSSTQGPSTQVFGELPTPLSSWNIAGPSSFRLADHDADCSVGCRLRCIRSLISNRRSRCVHRVLGAIDVNPTNFVLPIFYFIFLGVNFRRLCPARNGGGRHIILVIA